MPGLGSVCALSTVLPPYDTYHIMLVVECWGVLEVMGLQDACLSRWGGMAEMVGCGCGSDGVWPSLWRERMIKVSL